MELSTPDVHIKDSFPDWWTLESDMKHLKKAEGYITETFDYNIKNEVNSRNILINDKFMFNFMS